MDLLKTLSDLKLFKQKKIACLGIDIGSSSIKIVQLKKKGGRASLETYGELSLGPYSSQNIEAGKATNLSPSELSVALLDLLKEANVDTINCSVSIPLKSSLMSVIELPNVSEKELEQIIPIEIRKYIPVPISEVVIDWRIIPEPEKEINYTTVSDDAEDSEDKNKILNKIEGKLKAMVVAVHRESINKYKEIITNSKLNLQFWEIEIFSTIRSVTDVDVSTVAVLDIGAGVSKLYIVKHGVVYDSHIVSRGSQNVTLSIASALSVTPAEAEKKKREIGLSSDVSNKEVYDVISSSMEFIFNETNRVILNYQKKYNKNVSKVILTGGGSSIKNLLSFAVSKLETEVIMADPFSKVETPAFLENVLKEAGPGFSVAIGLALRGLEE